MIIKQSFRETNLRQIGKSPKFFDLDPKNVIEMENLKIRILCGFKASAF